MTQPTSHDVTDVTRSPPRRHTAAPEPPAHRKLPRLAICGGPASAKKPETSDSSARELIVSDSFRCMGWVAGAWVGKWAEAVRIAARGPAGPRSRAAVPLSRRSRGSPRQEIPRPPPRRGSRIADRPPPFGSLRVLRHRPARAGAPRDRTHGMGSPLAAPGRARVERDVFRRGMRQHVNDHESMENASPHVFETPGGGRSARGGAPQEASRMRCWALACGPELVAPPLLFPFFLLPMVPTRLSAGVRACLTTLRPHARGPLDARRSPAG